MVLFQHTHAMDKTIIHEKERVITEPQVPVVNTKPEKQLSPTFFAKSVTFSNDGRYIITTANDSFSLWDTKTGQLAQRIGPDCLADFTYDFSMGACDTRRRFIAVATPSKVYTFILGMVPSDEEHFWIRTPAELTNSCRGPNLVRSSSDRTMIIAFMSGPKLLNAYSYNSSSEKLEKIEFTCDEKKHKSDLLERIAMNSANTALIASTKTLELGVSYDVLTQKMSIIFDESKAAETSSFKKIKPLLLQFVDDASPYIFEWGPTGKVEQLVLLYRKNSTADPLVLDLNDTDNSMRVLIGHTGIIHFVFFNPPGTLVLTGSSDCTARAWDIKSGRCLKVFSIDAEVLAGAFSPTNDCFAISAGDKVNVYPVTSCYEG